MKVAFHAPLKAPDHPVPSGDRTMARALVKALGRAGCTVAQPSRFRSFLAAAEAARFAALAAQAEAETARIATQWAAEGPPDIWLTYHNYYKAPDLLGPALSCRFGLPYVLAESSYAPKRAENWTSWCDAADAASRCADLHLCFTPRDRDGIARVAPRRAALVDLPPFIDLDDVPQPGARSYAPPPRLLTVAMMRPGDKLASYQFLARALGGLRHAPWRLVIIGDGAARKEVEHAFVDIPADRLDWRGEMAGVDILRTMEQADLFVWPGFGEAFGLAYLEAQASGLPVLALDTAGVASVVADGRTGALVADPSPAAFAEALAALLAHPSRLAEMSPAASRFVRTERSLEQAAATLGLHLGRLASAREAIRV